MEWFHSCVHGNTVLLFNSATTEDSATRNHTTTCHHVGRLPQSPITHGMCVICIFYSSPLAEAIDTSCGDNTMVHRFLATRGTLQNSYFVCDAPQRMLMMWQRLMLWSGMNLRVYELSRSGKERMVRRFDHDGLRQLQFL